MDDSPLDASSGADPVDPELEAALDPFLDWAQARPEPRLKPVLPPLDSKEGLEAGEILGDYELVRRLGLGGMGIVFEARQRSVLGRSVALKVLRGAFSTRTLSRRFLREIAAVAELDHPGIVPVVDACTEGSVPFYVMKFVEGVSAARLIRELRELSRDTQSTASVRAIVESCSLLSASREDTGSGSGGDASAHFEEPYPRFVARLGFQLAQALQYAHEHGFVHRDVKPANIMVTREGRPVLLDFGLASHARDETLTQPGEFLGTVAYAAPEQVRGESVDTRGDVYSLGATLYELLTLRKPFDAENRSALARQIEHQDPPPLNPSVPADLCTIVLCALSKSASARYATPGAMAHDLREFLAGRPIRARPPGAVARAVRWIRRHPRLVTAAAAILLTWVGLQVFAHREAAARVESGQEFVRQYRLERQRWNELLLEYTQPSGSDPLPFLERRELHSNLERTRERAERLAQAADRELHRAFDHVGGFQPARDALAGLGAERLRQALRRNLDILRPELLEEHETSLREYDDRNAHAALLDHHGFVRLTCRKGPIMVELRSEFPPARTVYSGSTPTGPIRAVEGSYIARLSRAGGSEILLPLCIRRDAVYAEDPDARPAREIEIELPGPDELDERLEGFVFVHGGDTLLEDQPPRWAWVDSFQILRHEATNQQFVEWLNEFERLRDSLPESTGGLLAEPELPRLGDALCIERIGQRPGGIYRLRSEMGLGPDQPVRGLTPMGVHRFAELFDLIRPRPRTDHRFTLPSVAELTRAARGADGRRFPWGSQFDPGRCANYESCGFFGADASPVDAGAFPGDLSPFGILDLAGSVGESTRDLVAPVPNRYAVFGGSYRDVNQEEFTTTSVTTVANTNNPMVGFRLVYGRVPDWLVQPDAEPASFEDDFERPDDRVVGNGWQQVVGTHPLALRTNPTVIRNSRLESGRLICQGGSGHFSEASSVWRRIQVSEAAFRVSAVIRCEVAPGQPFPVAGYEFGLSLARGFLARESSYLRLLLLLDGTPLLQFSSPLSGTTTVKGAGRLSIGQLCMFEIDVRGRRAEGRIWPVEQPRPVRSGLSLTLPDTFQRPRYLGLNAPPGAGAKVEVDRVEVRCSR